MDRLRRRLAAARQSDSGMSLVELIVAMGIFTVVVSIFMAGVVVMTKSTARAQSVSDSGDMVRKVFQKLDREVRYSKAVNRPGAGTTAGTWYVEYLVTPQPGAAPGCVQWRYTASTRLLEYRWWTDVAPRTPSAWVMVAKNVRNDLSVPASRPFQFTAADGVHEKQQLRAVLDVGPGPAGVGAKKGAQLDSLFIARNTSTTSQSNADLDGNGQSDYPVCQTGVNRP